MVRASDPAFVGATVTAVYRLRFEADEPAQGSAVRGTIEGAVVRSCGSDQCTDFGQFPLGTYANPWSVGGNTITVSDFTGALVPGIVVRTWGPYTGLDASFRTQVDLAGPASSVDVRRSCTGPHRPASSLWTPPAGWSAPR